FIHPLRPRPHLPTLFPYTTLFRSSYTANAQWQRVAADHQKFVRETYAHVRQFSPAQGNASPELQPLSLASCVPKSVPGYSSVERSEEHTSELQSRFDLVCRLLLEK